VACGAALVRGALAPELLGDLLEAFLRLPEAETAALRHGAVRERREQTHLPFAPPFDGLPLLGAAGRLRAPLAAALGEGFVLDLVTVVAVPPGAKAQEPHRDTPEEGSIAAHFPLHDLDEELAPLGLCAGTHTLSNEDARHLMGEALLWRPKHETSNEAKQRLFCGGRQRTEPLRFSLAVGGQSEVRLRDSRLGAEVRGFASPEAEALPWRRGDEITHVAGQPVKESEDFFDNLPAAGEVVEVQLERPLPEQPARPPLLVVGAPLAAGDALLYDSRIWHWGMENRGSRTRYALYVNFKRDAGHPGVHPESRGSPELREALGAFRRRLLGLRDGQAAGAEL